MSRLLSLFAFAIAAGIQAGEPTYTLKIYEPKAGDLVRLTKTMTGVRSITLGNGAVKKSENLTIGEKTVYAEEILERPAGARPTKIKRVYDVAETTVKGSTDPLAYHGQTVLIEKTGDSFTFTMNGKKLPSPLAVELDNRFNGHSGDFHSSDFLPPGPVKVGESWGMKPDKVIKAFNDDPRLTIDPERSTFTAKLVRVKRAEAALIGVIELSSRIAVTKITLGPENTLPLTPESYSMQTLVFEGPIDGSPGTELLSAAVDICLEVARPKLTLIFTTISTGSSTETITPAP